MTTLKITAKGQITFKQALLKHIGVGPGQNIEAEMLPDGRILVSAAQQKGAIEDFIGCLAQKNMPSLSIDEIKEMTAQGWAGRR
jgi:bifunctional DNA-binding transcriptional regulator/antitoxin component of YhaV-PrlF toxin-antitoxin module